jgi:AcrR family transcriptional regulator
MSSPRSPLDEARIVDTALAVIREDGLSALSMRRLGARLGVDPMAVYHHVANKQLLLSLVVARVVAEVPAPDPDLPWAERVRRWALGYWDVVAANRALMAAALADPVVASGGLPILEPLRAAVVESGIDPALVEANVFLVVDVAHGSALGTTDPRRQDTADQEALRIAFERGLDTVLAGLASIASEGSRR